MKQAWRSGRAWHFALRLGLLLGLLASAGAPPARAQETPAQTPAIYLPIVTQAAGAARTLSPDGHIAVTVRVSDAAARHGALRFDITFDGKTVVSGGQLGIDGAGCPASASLRYEWLGFATHSVRSSYALPLGERSIVPDTYTELAVQLRRTNGDNGRRLTLLVRVYNEGVALRYLFPQEEGFGPVSICNGGGETTEFRLTGDPTIWQQASAASPSFSEATFERTTLSAVATQIETPLTVQHPDGYVLGLAEAAVENYPRAVLRRGDGSPPTLGFGFYDFANVTEPPVAGALPFRTPWRVLMIAPDFPTLLEQNYLLYSLSDPSRLGNMNWPRPGTAMRVMTLTNDGLRTAIDFAAARGIDYVELDAGWYVPGTVDDTFESNPAAELELPIGALDQVEALIDYAAGKGVGVVLYANYTPLRRNVDAVLSTYKAWGVSGIKLGFVRAYSQYDLNFIHYVVAEAARPEGESQGMFVNIHDDYRPSGLSRTYPNLVTQEGVRGNEWYPGPRHNATLPITRFLVGAADYTIPYYSGKQVGDPGYTTRTHQLALAIVYFSPLKFVLWYDSPQSYNGEPEVDLFGRVPTAWDETQVIEARPGELMTIARRSGDEWYLGAITDTNARTLSLPLDFLAPGQTYTATLYQDNPLEQGKVAMETLEVTQGSVLTATLAASGGYAAWFAPTENRQ